MRGNTKRIVHVSCVTIFMAIALMSGPIIVLDTEEFVNGIAPRAVLYPFLLN